MPCVAFKKWEVFCLAEYYMLSILVELVSGCTYVSAVHISSGVLLRTFSPRLLCTVNRNGIVPRSVFWLAQGTTECFF